MKLIQYFSNEIISIIAQYTGVNDTIKTYFTKFVLKELLEVVPIFNNIEFIISNFQITIFLPIDII